MHDSFPEGLPLKDLSRIDKELFRNFMSDSFPGQTFTKLNDQIEEALIDATPREKMICLDYRAALSRIKASGGFLCV